jgi:hypothetical protein
MRCLLCACGALLLCTATTVAAPAPFPKPVRSRQHFSLEFLQRQLCDRGIRLTDINQVGPSTWVVTFPDSRGGCLVGRPPTRSLRIEAPDRAKAITVFLSWWREQDERRLRELRARGAIP